MIKWTLIVIAAVVAFAALIALIGVFLPKGHTASRTATLAAPPDRVFAAVSDQSWFKMDFPVKVEVSEAPAKLVTRIADPKLPFGGTWTYVLKPSGAGTEITITEDGEVYNPFFRTMQKFVFSPYKTIDTYLASLAQHLALTR